MSQKKLKFMANIHSHSHSCDLIEWSNEIFKFLSIFNNGNVGDRDWNRVHKFTVIAISGR